MALDTFANLKAYLRSQSTRSEMSDGNLDDFILQAERAMYANPVAMIKVRGEETRSTALLSTSSRFLALPTSYLSMRRMIVRLDVGTTAERDLDILFQAPDQMQVLDADGVPNFFTVTSQLEFNRLPLVADTVEMQYFKSLTDLSSSNTSNDILTNFPDVYVFGCLRYLWLFAQEEEKAEFYKGQFYEAIRGANKKDRSGRYGSSPRMRIEGATP